MRVRRIGTWMVAVAALAALAMPSRADDRAVRKEIESAYARSIQSLKKKDLKALMAMLTPDATLKMPNGTVMSRQQMEGAMSQSFMMVKKFTDVSMKVTKFAMKGEKASVETTNKSVGVMTDEQGKERKLASISKSRDIWVKTAAGWRIKLIESLSEQVMIDGKPFPTSAAPSKR